MLLFSPKTSFPFAFLICCHCAFAQTPPSSGKFPHKCPSCLNLLIESARVLPALYQKKEFDSMTIFLDNRQRCCLHDVDVFCLKMLLAIQTHRFTKVEMESSDLYHYFQEAPKVLAAVLLKKGCHGYYSTRHFSACPYVTPVFTLIAAWAKQLTTAGLDSTELFLCNVLSGELWNPTKKIQEEKANYTFLDSPFVKSYALQRSEWSPNANINTGVLIPSGALKATGAHIGIYISLGFRNKTNEWNMVTGGQFINATHPYSILVGDTLHRGRHYNGWIVGADYTHYFLHTLHFEAGLLGSIGATGMELGYTPAGFTNIIYQHPSTFYQSIGLRANYFCGHYNPYKYIGLIARYDFLNYENADGIDLGGHTMYIGIAYGVN